MSNRFVLIAVVAAFALFAGFGPAKEKTAREENPPQEAVQEEIILSRPDPYDPSLFKNDQRASNRLAASLKKPVGEVPFTCTLKLSFPREDTFEIFFQQTERVNSTKSTHRGVRQIAGLTLPFEEYIDRRAGYAWQRDLRSGGLEKNSLSDTEEAALELSIPVRAVRSPAMFVKSVLLELAPATLVDYIGEELVDSRVCGVYELTAFGLPQNRLNFSKLRGRLYLEPQSGFLMKAELFEVNDFEEEPRLYFRADSVGSSRLWSQPEEDGEREDLQRMDETALNTALRNHEVKVGWIDFDHYEMSGERLEKLESLQSQRISPGKERVFGMILGESDWAEIEWYEKDGYVFKDDPNLEVNTAPILFPGIKPMLIREKLQTLLTDNELYLNAFVSEELDDNPDYLFFPDMSRFIDGECECYGNLWYDSNRGIFRNMSVLVRDAASGKVTIFRIKFLT